MFQEQIQNRELLFNKNNQSGSPKSCLRKLSTCTQNRKRQCVGREAQFSNNERMNAVTHQVSGLQKSKTNCLAQLATYEANTGTNDSCGEQGREKDPYRGVDYKQLDLGLKKEKAAGYGWTTEKLQVTA